MDDGLERHVIGEGAAPAAGGRHDVAYVIEQRGDDLEDGWTAAVGPRKVGHGRSVGDVGFAGHVLGECDQARQDVLREPLVGILQEDEGISRVIREVGSGEQRTVREVLRGLGAAFVQILDEDAGEKPGDPRGLTRHRPSPAPARRERSGDFLRAQPAARPRSTRTPAPCPAIDS